MGFTRLFLLVLLSQNALSFWMWSPGDAVDDSTQNAFATGYHPDQPLKKFSHRVHAKERELDCQYCHYEARRSASAGIPSLNHCMGCHQYVKTESEDIKLLTEKYEKNEPIEWVRVHDLPDFVRFSHKMHINAKDHNGKALLACETCHGDVKNTDAAEQWAPLQMGWCVDCHITPREQPVKRGQFMQHTYAPVSCNTCHF